MTSLLSLALSLVAISYRCNPSPPQGLGAYLVLRIVPRLTQLWGFALNRICRASWELNGGRCVEIFVLWVKGVFAVF